jgi:hypothetical protein
MEPNKILVVLLFFLGWNSSSIGQENLKGHEFEVHNGDITLSASLYLPDNDMSNYPVAIMVPGSADDTRESYLPYVPTIQSIGYAVVLYDKRGTGRSTGDFIKVSSTNSFKTIALRANDVSSIVDYLKKHPNIQKEKIGLLASSQGAWVASAVHKLTGDIGFIINYSGGVASVGESDYYDEIMDDASISIQEGNSKVNKFKGIIGFNPLPTIKKIEIPVLWIYGELDNSHPGRHDISVLKRMNKPNFSIQLLKNMNHDLIDVTTNSVSEEMINISMEWMSALE